MSPELRLPRERPDYFWEIAVAVNAAFKGLLGSMNESGHICARAQPVHVRLELESGWTSLVEQCAAALDQKIESGDVVVIAEKVVAAAERRLGPRAILYDPDPKTVPVEHLPALAERWQEHLGFEVSPLHLLLADEYPGNRATLGALDHNAAAADLARTLRTRLGAVVDTIVSDTDTGLDVRYPLIGTLTIGATPLGATAGLTLYEAMRCAAAAEFVRGHSRGIPLVVCKPADRRRVRAGSGEPRLYSGALNATREPGLSHA